MSIRVTGLDLVDIIRTGASKPVILDVRWNPGHETGYDDYLNGHIPSAQFCDPSYHLASTPGRDSGRNPLPDPDLLQLAISRWGISPDSQVILYDAVGGIYAARAWWVLRWAGLTNLYLLDGGIHAWTQTGSQLACGPGNPVRHGTSVVKPGSMRVITTDEVEEFQRDGILIDTREPERYAGLHEPLDFQAGHIPGAINLPAYSLTEADGRFKSATEISAMFAELGVTDGRKVAVYSGSGVHSSLTLAALDLVGLDGAAHYAAGWSRWSGDRSRPVRRGFEP